MGISFSDKEGNLISLEAFIASYKENKEFCLSVSSLLQKCFAELAEVREELDVLKKNRRPDSDVGRVGLSFLPSGVSALIPPKAKVRCGFCMGTGYGEGIEDEICPQCHGKGYVE